MPLPEHDPRVRINKCAYVVYEHADLAKAEQFLLDFGMTVAERRSNGKIFFKGYGPDPFVYQAYGGAAYLVESREELEKAVVRIPNALSITSLDAPDGGEVVALRDPAGHPVHLVHGQAEKPLEELNLPKLVVNYEDKKPRKGQFQLLQTWSRSSPQMGTLWRNVSAWHISTDVRLVHKLLGTCAIRHCVQPIEPMTCFFHIDRGTTFTDHHAFFFKPAKLGDSSSVAHAAFEVHDFDVQQLGHDWLMQKGHELCWGVGRHVLGSQVFDYWFDTSGFMGRVDWFYYFHPVAKQSVPMSLDDSAVSDIAKEEPSGEECGDLL